MRVKTQPTRSIERSQLPFGGENGALRLVAAPYFIVAASLRAAWTARKEAA